MRVDVIMPQMGESIQEGTIVKWLKKVGDSVGRDEPLFEISTDKVDAEIPSPSAGTLAEVKVKEGETVAIKTIVAVIETEAGKAASAPAPQAAEKPAPQPAAPAPPPRPAPSAPPPVSPAPSATAPAQAAAASAERAAAAPQPSSGPSYGGGPAGAGGGRAAYEGAGGAGPSRGGGTGTAVLEERIRTKSSPVVRKIAAEHGVDITALQGSGIMGRVTKNDILGYLEGRESAPEGAGAQAAAPALAAAAAPQGTMPSEALKAYPAFLPGERFERVPMTPMRKKIAEHMVVSKRTSAHVSTWFEIDMTRVAKIRGAKKEAFQQRHGVNLSFMPFIMKATVDALLAFPALNASIEGNDILYKKDVSLGIAVALDWGLIVPVVKNAQDLSLSGLAKAMNDLADRARKKQLKPEEVQGGTFTITNPGIFGSLMGTPIINQPQVAILGVGTIEKRPVVIDDAIAIRTMAYFSISFDHRLVDGALADQFMARIKQTLQEFDESAV